MLLETRDRGEYLSGTVVYYFDHDVPIKSAATDKAEYQLLEDLPKEEGTFLNRFVVQENLRIEVINDKIQYV